MKNKFLPLGSVVLLQGASKKIMITGFCVTDKNEINKKYDYCGCLYPEGIVNTNKIAVFNHDQINKIFYVGYIDDDSRVFFEKLNATINNK